MKQQQYLPDTPDMEIIDVRVTPVQFNVLSPKSSAGWKGTQKFGVSREKSPSHNLHDFCKISEVAVDKDDNDHYESARVSEKEFDPNDLESIALKYGLNLLKPPEFSTVNDKDSDNSDRSDRMRIKHYANYTDGLLPD